MANDQIRQLRHAAELARTAATAAYRANHLGAETAIREGARQLDALANLLDNHELDPELEAEVRRAHLRGNKQP